MLKFRLVLLIGLAAALTACIKTEVESWRVLENPDVDAVNAKAGVDFGIYSRLYLEPFEIFYPEELGEPDPDIDARIRSIYRQAFLDAIDNQYELVTQTGDDVLKVRFSLLDLRLSKPDSNFTPPSRLTEFVHSGHQTLLMELIDSETDEVLVRAADEERPDNVTIKDNYDDWDAVTFTANRWANLFRDFLDDNLKKP